MTSATAAPTRGRPRNEDRTTAILDATLDLLTSEGYDSLRMQDVADRAGVGLATIYRRWETKQDLVAAAMDCKPPPDIEPTGDARTDLRATLHWMADEMGSKGEYIAGLMIAAHEHAVIAEAIRGSVRQTMRESLGELLIEVVGDRPVIDTLIDAIPGVLLFRSGLLDEPVDPDAFADEAMALVDSFCGAS
ncbi:MAG: TetR/AcrR family transcriptional regulator [Actinomycetota bacterium]